MTPSSPGLCLNVAFSGAFPDCPDEMAANPILSSFASLFLGLPTWNGCFRHCGVHNAQNNCLGHSGCLRTCCEMGEWGVCVCTCVCTCTHTHMHIYDSWHYLCRYMYIHTYIYIIAGIMYLRRICIRSEFGEHKTNRKIKVQQG